jgi:hypothetical protein
MSVIDRINDWALKRLGRRTGVREVVVTESGITWRQGSTQIKASWQSVGRVLAFQRPTLAGDEISLIFELDDGRVVEVSRDWAGWDALVANLEVHLPGARRYGEWLPDLIRTTPQVTIAVYSK